MRNGIARLPRLPSHWCIGRTGGFACLALLLTGCGYVGEPLPPALRRPVLVNDLAAVQVGSNIVIQFTIPKITTEDLPIKGGEDIELRVGPQAPDMASWQRTSDRETVSARDARSEEHTSEL